MSKGRDRTVYRRGDKWVNKRNGASRASSVHDNQKDADNTARQMLRNQGVRELTKMGRNGQTRSKDTIPPGKDLCPLKDKEH